MASRRRSSPSISRSRATSRFGSAELCRDRANPVAGPDGQVEVEALHEVIIEDMLQDVDHGLALDLSPRRHAETDREDPLAVTNPVVLVEVLSPSTQTYDRGDKLDHYKPIPSLREVVFVGCDERRIEVVRRTGDGWVRVEASEGEPAIESIGCTLAVADVYRDPLGDEA